MPLALLLFFALSGRSQSIFIPDVNLRTWLNNARPNSVDANGLCDTALWNAQPPSFVLAALNTLPNGATVDLEGIQHLKMGQFKVSTGLVNNIAVDWPGYPIGLSELELQDVDAGLFTGAFLPLPLDLDVLTCQTCGLGTLPPFNGSEMVFWEEDLSGQVLSVPPSVTTLVMKECNLSSLPAMPNVTSLTVSDNPLGSLPPLPTGLTFLNAINTGISSVPTLPAGLVFLSLGRNSITSLPPLPSSLQTLSVPWNQLTTLPALPNVLIELDVSYNPIPALPPLGTLLRELEVDSCGMTAIQYPSSLRILSIRYNPIDSLPPFGPFFQTANVRDCPQLTCLPVLPNTTTFVLAAGSGITCLPNLPPNLNTSNLGFAPVVCDIGTSPCPLSAPLITGTTFQDDNGDGVRDPWEVVWPNQMVIAQPGDLITASDINGAYALPAGIGAFTVTGVPGPYAPVTTSPLAVSFTSPGQVDTANHIGFIATPGITDLVTTVTSDPVRPGFNTYAWVTVTNVGTDNTTAVVELTFDAALSYLTSNVTPANVNGNVVQWNTPLLLAGEQWTVFVGLYGPPTLVLGTPWVHQATATPLFADQTPADNTYVLSDVVVGSYDPNDKQVTPQVLSPADILAGTPVQYKVRFQNTGTFPAERVLITDTLPAGLQLASMQFDATSHPCTWYIHQGVLHVLYEGINLPDSTSDEPNSHGFVKFTFTPQNTLQVGDVVGNVANIYFDFNEPIITNSADFSVEITTGSGEADLESAWLWPNPAGDLLEVRTALPFHGTLQVLDLSGRAVWSGRTTGTRHLLELGALPDGAYTLRFQGEDGPRAMRFMKQ